VEVYVIATIFILLGISICFLGSKMIPIVLWLICSIATGLVLLLLILSVSQAKADEPIGIFFTLLSLMIALPLGYKAANMLEKYALSVVCGLAGGLAMELLCDFLLIKNDF
jgi:hypothetical protein